MKRDVRIINRMLDTIKDKPIPFDRRQLKYFFVIQHLLEQQQTMYKKKSYQVEDRIVSIHQPHVRPIVRGKAKARTEFGAKINISLLDGYARVDHFDWDASGEGRQNLQAQVERFRKLTGKYPELVQVDKIYLNRENRRFLKEKAIRYTGEPLGRKPAKELRSRYQKRKERREAAERNQIEGKFGQGKRGYCLNDIRARLATTSNSWIGAIIFVMNLIRHMRDIPLPNFVTLLLKLMKVRNINIYPVKQQIKLCTRLEINKQTLNTKIMEEKLFFIQHVSLQDEFLGSKGRGITHRINEKNCNTDKDDALGKKYVHGWNGIQELEKELKEKKITISRCKHCFPSSMSDSVPEGMEAFKEHEF